jgi:hypothetical protein
MKIFKGSGSKKSSSPPSPPPPAPDNLRSKDALEAIVAISEGPIAGLVQGDKSFYLENTPLRATDGKLNFQDSWLRFYYGNSDDPVIESVLGGQASSTSVNVKLEQEVPVTRESQLRQIDRIDLRFVINGLYQQTKPENGSIPINLLIRWRAKGQTTWNSQTESITGKTQSQYVREVVLSVTKVAVPYEIEVTLYPHDSTFTANVFWESFQEKITTNRAYPNTAVAHVYSRASEQLSGIPEFSGIYRGILCRVPVNYDPGTRIYSGAWNGTFKFAWTNNPAWIIYDLIMNDRYGANAYGGLVLNKWDVYAAAQYCDQFVRNEYDDWEPRFTCNLILQEQRSILETARYLAGIFNGAFYDDLDGTLRLRYLDQSAPVGMFTNENVINGQFQYTFTDVSDRYNRITGSFQNPNLNWEEDRVIRQDTDAIERYGVIADETLLVGCTSPTEAIRRVNYRLALAQNQTAMCSFVTNRSACFVRPYDRIIIHDNDASAGESMRISGVSLDRQTVMFGRPVVLTDAKNFIQFQTPGGVTGYYRVTQGPGTYTSLNTTQPIVALPSTEAVCRIQPSTALAFSERVVLGPDAIWISDDGVTPKQLLGKRVAVNYQLVVPTAGTYTFSVAGDDVSGVEIVGIGSYPGPFGPPTSYAVPLQPGTYTVIFWAWNNPGFGADFGTNPGTLIGYINAPGGAKIMSVATDGQLQLEASDENMWRVLSVTENDGNPDQLSVFCIEDYADGIFQPGFGNPGGYNQNTSFTPSIPIDTIPADCTDFTVAVSTGTNGNKLCFTPVCPGSADFDVYRQRGTEWDKIVLDANGCYETADCGSIVFRMIGRSAVGVSGNFSTGRTKTISVPCCPPNLATLGKVTNLQLAQLPDTATPGGFQYLVTWDTTGVNMDAYYMEGFVVTIWRMNGSTPVKIKDVATRDFFFTYTYAQMIADGGPYAGGYRFSVVTKNKCGQTSGDTGGQNQTDPNAGQSTVAPGKSVVLTTDVQENVNFNCKELQKPVLAGYTEKIIEFNNSSASHTLDLSLANTFVIYANVNKTLTMTGQCANAAVPVTVVVIQPSVPGKQVTFTGVKWRNRRVPTTTNLANAIDMFVLYNVGAAGWLGAMNENFG